MTVEPNKRSKFVPLGGAPGPALPIRPTRATAMVEHAVAQRAIRARARRRRWNAAIIAAATLVALAVLAAIGALRSTPPSPPPIPKTSSPSIAPEPEAPPSSSLDPAPEAPPPSHSSGAVHAPVPSTVVTVEDLLLRANRLRGERRWQEAARTYERAIALAPGSPHAYAARAASAALHLEHLSDPRGALTLYREALERRPEGPLSEEMEWGVAECYRALGDTDSETNTVRAFLAAHPGSWMQTRAEKRLQTLAGDGPAP